MNILNFFIKLHFLIISNIKPFKAAFSDKPGIFTSTP